MKNQGPHDYHIKVQDRTLMPLFFQPLCLVVSSVHIHGELFVGLAEKEGGVFEDKYLRS